MTREELIIYKANHFKGFLESKHRELTKILASINLERDAEVIEDITPLLKYYEEFIRS